MNSPDTNNRELKESEERTIKNVKELFAADDPIKQHDIDAVACYITGCVVGYDPSNPMYEEKESLWLLGKSLIESGYGEYYKELLITFSENPGSDFQYGYFDTTKDVINASTQNKTTIITSSGILTLATSVIGGEVLGPVLVSDIAYSSSVPLWQLSLVGATGGAVGYTGAQGVAYINTGNWQWNWYSFGVSTAAGGLGINVNLYIAPLFGVGVSTINSGLIGDSYEETKDKWLYAAEWSLFGSAAGTYFTNIMPKVISTPAATGFSTATSELLGDLFTDGMNKKMNKKIANKRSFYSDYWKNFFVYLFIYTYMSIFIVLMVYINNIEITFSKLLLTFLFDIILSLFTALLQEISNYLIMRSHNRKK